MEELLGQLLASPVPPHALALLLGMPSNVLYLLEVIVVVKHRASFNQHFFCLFVARALPSIYNMFNNYLCLRFGMLNLFYGFYQTMPGWLFTYLYFISFYNFHLENVATTFLALNRLTAILFPMQNDRIWKWLNRPALLVIFTLPLTGSVQIIGIDLRLLKYPDYFTFVNDEQERPIAFDAAVSSATFLCLCGLLNLACLLAYRFHRAKNNTMLMPNSIGGGSGNSSSQKQLQVEADRIRKRLTIYAFGTFICQLSMAAVHYALYIMDTVPQNSTPLFSSTALLNYYGLINDLSTVVVPAWLMLWASSQMRSLIHREWDRAASSRSRLCCCCCRWHKIGPLDDAGGRINN